MSEVLCFVCGQPLVWDAYNNVYHCRCDETESARAFRMLQEEAGKYTELIRQVLADFATQVWGIQESWVLSSAPQYHNVEAKRNYAWVGSVRKSDYKYDRRKDLVTADERYSILLEDERTFRVVAFEDYGYLIDNTSTAYLCLTEISLKTGLSEQELRTGVQKLYAFLKNHSVPLIIHGYERPADADTITEAGSGIQLRTQVVGKHS